METNAQKILRSVTLPLYKDEITKMIKGYLEKEGFEVRDVDFKVSRQTRGYGIGGYETFEFEKCIVSCRLITERREDDENR